jgi:hypothetical protein
MTDSELDQSRDDRDPVLDLFAPVPAVPLASTGSFRFGIGEFDLPGFSLARWSALRELVRALRLEAPEAYTDAIAKARPFAATMMADADSKDVRIPDPRIIQMCQRMLESTDPVTREVGLRTFLAEWFKGADDFGANLDETILNAQAEWAARWNLDDESAVAFVTLVFLDATDEAFFELTGRRFADTVIAAMRHAALLRLGLLKVVNAAAAQWDTERKLEPSLSATLSFEFPAFNPFSQSKQDYKAHARRAFEHALAAHTDAQLLRIEPVGARKTPLKRLPEQHFRWYIQYQVLGQSLGAIAEASWAERGAVSAAVHSVAQLASVPVREGLPGGRPKKA